MIKRLIAASIATTIGCTDMTFKGKIGDSDVQLKRIISPLDTTDNLKIKNDKGCDYTISAIDGNVSYAKVDCQDFSFESENPSFLEKNISRIYREYTTKIKELTAR